MPSQFLHRKDDFNLIAPLYDIIAHITFAGRIQRAQEQLIPTLQNTQKLLLIGGGTGKILESILTRYPQLSIIYLEASSAMIHRAQARLNEAQNARVLWLHDTHERLYQEPTLLLDVDAIFTCFFLDVLSPQEAHDFMGWITKQLSQNHRTGSLWLIADFYPHQGWKGAIIRLMYLIFKVITRLDNQILIDYTRIAYELGWKRQSKMDFAYQMIYAEHLSLK